MYFSVNNLLFHQTLYEYITIKLHTSVELLTLSVGELPTVVSIYTLIIGESTIVV